MSQPQGQLGRYGVPRYLGRGGGQQAACGQEAVPALSRLRAEDGQEGQALVLGRRPTPVTRGQRARPRAELASPHRPPRTRSVAHTHSPPAVRVETRLLRPARAPDHEKPACERV